MVSRNFNGHREQQRAKTAATKSEVLLLHNARQEAEANRMAVQNVRFIFSLAKGNLFSFSCSNKFS